MATSVLRIPKSCHLLPGHELSRLKDALEVLLGVKCCFSHTSLENENPEESESKVKQVQAQELQITLILTIIFESEISSKHIAKAERFILAHLSPSSDYMISPNYLKTRQEFDMVVQRASKIQSATTALLTFEPESKKITVQGSRGSVEDARAKIVEILENLEDQRSGLLPLESVASVGEAQSPKYMGWFSSSDVAANQADQGDLAGNMPGLVQPGKSSTPVDKFSLAVNEPVEKEIRTSCSNEEFSSSSSSDEEGEAEDLGDKLFVDAKCGKHVELALKMGYNEEQVKKALVKLGPGCDSNDFLLEVISISKAGSDLGQQEESLTEQDSSELQSRNFSHFPQSQAVSMEDAGSGSFRLAGSLHQLQPPTPASNPFSPGIPANAPSSEDKTNLRHIIIDGSNVAMSHGKKCFSCKGIKIVVDWFRERGHEYITAFVPKWRKETSRPDAPITDQDLLLELEKDNVVVFTPARRVKGQRVVCYDDRYILNLAVATEGIVVSNDIYRDLVTEREDFRRVVDQRLLMYTFVNDRFMPPEDPLGRTGPSLDNFLRKVPIDPWPRPPDCPYGKKCTYGNKCRYYHPERGFAQQKSVTDTLKEQADVKLQERASKISEHTTGAEGRPGDKGRRPKQKLVRTKSLIPGAVLSQGDSNPGEKPKLAHSTSLNLCPKTPDYLDGARRKFEEAEWNLAMTQLSVGQSPPPPSQQPASCASALPQTWGFIGSPTPGPAIPSGSLVDSTHRARQSLGLAQEGGCNVRAQLSSSPVCSKVMSSRASPSHLSAEPYVSGHLAVAQKLSDEGSDSNFFSEHTANNSASSTPRTRSPVVPPSAANAGESRLVNKGLGSVVPSSDGEVPETQAPVLRQAVTSQGEATATAAPVPVNVGSLQPEIPNLSLFNEECFQSMSQHARQEVLTKASQRDPGSFSAGSNPLSPDSGLSVSPSIHKSSDYLFEGLPPTSTSAYSPATSYPVQGFPTERLSSTRNVYQPPLSRHKFAGERRGSDFPTGQKSLSHMVLRPQSSVPDMVSQQTVIATSQSSRVPFGLTRQNSTSDPQIHVSAMHQPSDSSSSVSGVNQAYTGFGECLVYQPPPSGHPANMGLYGGPLHQAELQARPYSMGGGGGRVPGMQQDFQSQDPQYSGRAMSFDNQLYNRRLQHSTPQYNMGQQYPGMAVDAGAAGMVPSYPFSMQLPSAPTMSTFQQQHYQQLQQQQQQQIVYPQHHQTVPMYSNGGCSSTDARLDVGQMLMSQPPSSGGGQFYQQPPPNFTSPPSLQYYPGQVAARPMSGPYSQPNMAYPPPSQPGPSQTMPQLTQEDAPILPADPRFSLYCNLSTVFNEKLVRTVMNRHPHVTKSSEIADIIHKYTNLVL